MAMRTAKNARTESKYSIVGTCSRVGGTTVSAVYYEDLCLETKLTNHRDYPRGESRQRIVSCSATRRKFIQSLGIASAICLTPETICSGFIFHPDGNLRDSRCPVARTLTPVPPTSITDTLRRLVLRVMIYPSDERGQTSNSLESLQLARLLILTGTSSARSIAPDSLGGVRDVGTSCSAKSAST
jgi:hypothetical protein